MSVPAFRVKRVHGCGYSRGFSPRFLLFFYTKITVAACQPDVKLCFIQDMCGVYILYALTLYQDGKV